MSDPKLWERIRKCELAIQKVCIDLAAIGEELRLAEEPQKHETEYSNERP